MVTTPHILEQKDPERTGRVDHLGLHVLQDSKIQDSGVGESKGHQQVPLYSWCHPDTISY